MNKITLSLIQIFFLTAGTAMAMQPKNATSIENIPIDTMATLLEQHLALLEAIQAPLSPRTSAGCRSALAALGKQSQSDAELEEKRQALFSAFMSLFNTSAKPCPRCQATKEEKQNRDLESYTERMIERALQDRAAGLDPYCLSNDAQSKDEFKKLDAVKYVEMWTTRRNMAVLPWHIKKILQK